MWPSHITRPGWDKSLRLFLSVSVLGHDLVKNMLFLLLQG